MPNDYDPNTWSTPQDLYDALDEIFHFTLDAAASASNAKCERFWTKEDDGLSKSWGGESVWCNPPYGKDLLEPWLEKAFVETSFIGRQKGEYANVAVLLLPARTSMGWFHEYCLFAELFYIKGRVSFVKPKGYTGKESGPSEHHMIAVFGGGSYSRNNLQHVLSNPTDAMRGMKGKKVEGSLFDA